MNRNILLDINKTIQEINQATDRLHRTINPNNDDHTAFVDRSRINEALNVLVRNQQTLDGLLKKLFDEIKADDEKTRKLQQDFIDKQRDFDVQLKEARRSSGGKAGRLDPVSLFVPANPLNAKSPFVCEFTTDQESIRFASEPPKRDEPKRAASPEWDDFCSSLTPRTIAALEQSGIADVKSVCNMTQNELLMILMFGAESLDEIKGVLKAKRLSLKRRSKP